MVISEKSPRYLYSSGNDNSIRVWDLNDYTKVFNMRIDMITEHVYLFSDSIAFAIDKDSHRSAICKFNAHFFDPVVTEASGSKLIHLSSNKEWGMALYSTNHIECFTYEDYTKRQK